MATTRPLLRSSRAFRHLLPPTRTNASSNSTVKCTSNKARLVGGEGASGDGNKRKVPLLALEASVATPESSLTITAEPAVDRDVPSFLADVSNALLRILKPAAQNKTWKLEAQMFIQKVIIDCRFFTLIGVAGSLLGSILCFVEGCFLILESFLQYFSAWSKSLDQAHVIKLLIEAIDMFLVGSAMLIFGVGLYVMFVGSKNPKVQVPGSNFFGLFYLESLPTWVEMESISKAKSKIGHAIVMILQVGVMEKFKDIPLVTSLDLACLAGAVLFSTAGTFLLSRLSVGSNGILEDR